MGEVIKVTALISKKATVEFNSYSISLGATEELLPHERKDWKKSQIVLAEQLKGLVNESFRTGDGNGKTGLVIRIPAIIKRLLPGKD